MAVLTGLTYGGNTWTPKFAQEIDKDKCIGCGRCIKVCGYPVLDLKALNEEGEFVDDEEDDEIERKVMVVAHPENCIGCQACARICPKNCYTHATLEN
ncbi:ferredoxin III, nif-specific [Nostoc sp. MS1]|uniref:ferredoxin III, nif-specific n=1 Tax=Nostoc sp. MS1 TaxID=2764711 RepID=UPI001CC598E4|nr:ferredoxin III, nif-specific [Nostoc sp. MS1]BCL36574.1 ferredoxin III, nif-specific [Nostoc sp. MS1]